ncbi:MAG: TonB-dependent receptor, partial [Desulfobacterales bacterium]|nr:TonB-dependent receptor [Desulfobacterales bacterium]
DITDVPQLILGGNNNADRTSTRYLHKADYARLKNLRLAYNIPDNVTKSIGLDNIKVYAQGQNLLTLTDYPGKDPEVQVNGIEDWFYPPLRTITLGLTVDF